MKQENYHPEQVQLLQAVYDMRQAQKAYFNERSNYKLKEAKLKESRVDALLVPWIKAGIVKDKKSINIQQGGLFV